MLVASDRSSESHNHGQHEMTNQSSTGFSGLGIAPALLGAIDKLKFTEPTPIQRRSIPIGLEGKDLIAIAQTGTGKTLAFGIPLLQRLAQLKGRGLVLLPTRELAQQVDQSLHAIGRQFGLQTAVLIGGASMNVQLQMLSKKPRVLIATPGRLLDHMEQRSVNLGDIRILILDEADRMLDMGFAPQISKILSRMTGERQTMLFSATMPAEIVDIAKRHMHLPLQVEIAPPGTTADRILQEVFFLTKEAKPQLLEHMLQSTKGPTLIFTRTKHGARKLTRYVKGSLGLNAAELHSDRSLAQRKEALDGFKQGKYPILIATDIAARGIDVFGIELVINYDLPSTSGDYVHRIGRTARAGATGRAVSFATFDQRNDIRSIEQLIKTTLPIRPLPEPLAKKFGLPASSPLAQRIKAEIEQREKQESRSDDRDDAGSAGFGRRPQRRRR